MNDRLVQLHDGELGDDEATRMRASLTEAADRALLDAMHRVDRTLVEVDRLMGPGAERIESGKQALKAILRGRANGHEPRRVRAVFRRPVFAAVGGALAAAAAITIWAAWPGPHVIGTVQYRGTRGLSSDQPPAAIWLGSVVRAPSDGEADIDVPGVFQMQLSRGGEIRIGRSAGDLRLVCGWATLQTFAEVTLRLGEAPHCVVASFPSTLKVRMSESDIELIQQSGTSVVVAGDQRQTVAAGATVRIELARSSLIEPDGREQ